mgnify:CR=1 FL=1
MESLLIGIETAEELHLIVVMFILVGAAIFGDLFIYNNNEDKNK